MYVLQFQPWIFFYSISSESAKWSKIVRGEVNYNKRSKLYPTWASISLPHECGGGWPALKLLWLWSLTWWVMKSLTSKATPLATQFYIQLFYMPHFGAWILLFGPFGQLRQQGKKSGFELFWATFEGGFFNFLRAKKINF